MKKILLLFLVVLAYFSITAFISAHYGMGAGTMCAIAPFVTPFKFKKKQTAPIFVCMQWRLSGILSDVAGKFGGSVVYKGRTGVTMRNMRRGKNPRTILQTARRGQFSSASQYWRLLLPTQIKAWIAAARLVPRKNKVGLTFTGSGSSFFSAVNDFAAFVNYAAGLNSIAAPVTLPIADVPSFISPTNNGPVAGFDPSNVSGTQGMKLDIPLVSTGDILIVEGTPQLSPGIGNPKGKFKAFTAFGAHAALPAEDVLTEYQAQFGDLVAGKKIFIRAYYYSIAGGHPVIRNAAPELSGVVRAV